MQLGCGSNAVMQRLFCSSAANLLQLCFRLIAVLPKFGYRFAAALLLFVAILFGSPIAHPQEFWYGSAAVLPHFAVVLLRFFSSSVAVMWQRCCSSLGVRESCRYHRLGFASAHALEVGYPVVDLLMSLLAPCGPRILQPHS